METSDRSRASSPARETRNVRCCSGNLIHPAAHRRITRLAAQPEMGLLSQRRARIDGPDHAAALAAWSSLIRDIKTNKEDKKMASDILQGRWKQMRGDLRIWWGKLTDDDFDRIQGSREKLMGALQEKYGYTRAQADAEIDRRLLEYDQKHRLPPNQPPGARP